jgi:hypothetical protein
MQRNRFWIRTAAIAATGLALSLQPLAGATRQVQVIDPAVQMKAFTFTIPANWIFEGTVMSGSSCMDTPIPIFRAMSPDGITELKQLPRLDWSWQTGSTLKTRAHPDCLDLNRMLPAAEFLKYMVGVLGVTFVREEPAPNLAEYQANLRRMNEQNAKSPMPLKISGDTARFLVRYNINSIPVEERLSATIRCSENTRRFGVNQVLMSLYACSAWVTRARARQGQLDSLEETFKAVGKSMTADPQWIQKRTDIEVAKIHEQQRQGMEAIKQQGQAIAAASQARHEAFMQSQAMRQRQHEQFMATMQRGTDMSMHRTQESMNARSRMAGDWADYALDQQKRRDPRTGEITKDSSAYTYSWVDESGKRVQTNDVNDNPNGRLSGNWTLQQNVR